MVTAVTQRLFPGDGRLALFETLGVLAALILSAGASASTERSSPLTCRSGKTLFHKSGVRAFVVVRMFVDRDHPRERSPYKTFYVCGQGSHKPRVIDKGDPFTRTVAYGFRLFGLRLGFVTVEAGGHVRGVVPAMELLAQVRAAVPDNYPVLSAGDIADASDVTARLEAGAEAVVCGTRFLMTQESGAHPIYKARLIEARETVGRSRWTISTSATGHETRFCFGGCGSRERGYDDARSGAIRCDWGAAHWTARRWCCPNADTDVVRAASRLDKPLERGPGLRRPRTVQSEFDGCLRRFGKLAERPLGCAW